jgi:hypothetical protein
LDFGGLFRRNERLPGYVVLYDSLERISINEKRLAFLVPDLK